MDNKHIRNKKKRLLKKYSQKNVSNAKTNSYFSEYNFDNFLNNIKTEKHKSNDLEDSSSIVCKIVSMHTNYPSTALPIMKISSPKTEPHTCLEYCFKCNHVFRVLDRPFHIRRIRSIEKKNEFLKIDPSLCVDSCLCDYCWKDLEKTYKSIKSKNRKEETNSEKKSRLLERCAKKNVSKNQNKAKRCSINLCSRSNCQKMSVNDCENIKKLFLTFESCRLVFVPSTKQTTDFLKFTFGFCKMHNDMISVMSTCQICGDKLNAPFNTEDWLMYEIWNFVLIENNLPLILKPGMFICVTCKGHISKKNPGVPTIDLPRLREYILKSNSIRLKLYGESHNNLFNRCKGSTYLAPPIVVANIKEEKECVHSTRIDFSDALKANYLNCEIGCYKNDTKSITSTALLQLAQNNMCTLKLELKDEVLSFEKFEEYFRKYDKNFQHLCQVDNVKMYENKSGIIGSYPVVSEHIAIENNQIKLNSHAICSDEEDISSMNLKEGIQCMNKTNTIHKNIYLNETDNSMYSFIAAADPPSTINNDVPIKINQNNVIFDAISNKYVKKQSLNERYNYYENNSTEDNTTKSFRNKIIDHPSINSPRILNMNSNCKNIYDSDISDFEMFSETDSKEILPDCEKKVTDYIIIASDDDLSLDSNCKFIKSKFDIKSHHEIEMDKNNTKSITSPVLLNVAQQNPCTSKLELNDEGLDIVNFEEEYYRRHDNSLQILCQVDNVEIVEKVSGLISSCQFVSENNEIVNNQSKLNYHAISSVAQDRNSMDLKERNQCITEINTIHKTDCLKEIENSMYSFIAAADPPSTINNDVPIKINQNNVIFDAISNKYVKKQSLNEKYNYYENKSTEDNTTKSFRNKIIDHPSINSPRILNMNSNCKNIYDSNSDISDSEMFSETDSKEILLDCEKKVTDYIIIASDDDLSLDSNCKFIKSKFDIKPHHEVEMDKNDTKSITSTVLLNVAQQNLCTSKLELNDEGLDIVNFEEEYYRRHDNSLQILCQVNNVEIVEKVPGLIGSHPVVSEHIAIENNQSKLNSHVICSVAQDRCSMDLKERNQCITKINTTHKTDCLKETDNGMYPFIAAVEPSSTIINHVSIKRKQSNVIFDTICNKDFKKQRLNQKYNYYENNSTEDNTTKSYRNKIIDHPSINSPRILNMNSNCKNIYDSDISDFEMFSETDSKEILPDCEKKVTDYIIIASDDDLSLDSNCKFIKSKFDIKSHHEIEMDKNNTKSITSPVLLNVAQQNPCTSKLELNDEGLDIVNFEEEYYRRHDNSLQILCQVDNVEIVEKVSGLISSCQFVSENNEIVNNQSKLNYHAISSVAQDRNSMDLKERNQCITEINTIHKTDCLKEIENSMYSFIAAADPPSTINNDVPIKINQNNVIFDAISNKYVKKQSLNEKYNYYENKSTEDNTTKSFRNKIIDHPSINSPRILNMNSNCKNIYDSNSDISDSEMFSETDSKEILLDCEKKVTDYIIIASDDDLSLDSNCKFIKSKFDIKPHHEVEMDKNDTKSITSTVLLNVAQQNLCTSKLELNDEGLDIVNFEEEYYRRHDNSLQILCQVNNVEIVEKVPGLIGSHPVVSEHIAIENNQSKLNSHVICSVAQDRCSMDLKERNQCITKINTTHKTDCLKETDNGMYPFIAAVEPSSTIINHVSIKRKQSNVIFDTICNKDFKKQRLNQKYNYYENNSTEDNTTKSYRNKIIDHPSINSPRILNMNSNCKNIYDSDISDFEMFSETDSKEILPDCEKKVTDYIIIASDDDLSLDSNCKFIKSKFDIKSHHEIEMDKNNTKSITSPVLLNVAQQNPCTSKLELNDEGLDIVNFEEEYYRRHDNSLQNLCQVDNVEIVENKSGIISSHQVVSDHNDVENNQSKLTDNIIVASTVDLCLDSNCELVKSTFEIKPNHETEMDCEIVSDTEKSIVGKIISTGDNVLESYATYLDRVKESNCEMVPIAETDSDRNEQSHLNISVTEEVNKKLSTLKIVSNVPKRLDDEILLDGDTVVGTASWSENGTIKYKIIFDDEINPSGNQGSTCIIISDNDQEFNNRVFSTYKINVQKGSDSKIILDGEKVKILSKSENKKAKYEINSSANNKSICIIIFDNEKEFINKTLSTYKNVSNVEKELDSEMLSDTEKVYDIESDSENRKIQYMIVSKNEMKSSDNKGPQCIIISDNEEKFNNKKSTFNILVKNVQKESHSALMNGEKSHKKLSENENGSLKCMIPSNNEEEFNYKKVSDITIR